MKKQRKLLHNLSLFNIFLGIIVALLANFIILPLLNISVLSVFQSSKNTAPGQLNRSTENQISVKSPSDYILISDENIFHPDRKIPAEKKEDQPLPKPVIILHGTLITDETSLAYLEDLKALRTTPGRGRRQISMKKGESISGFVLSEIDVGKIVLIRGEEQIVVSISDSHQSKKNGLINSHGANQSQKDKRPAALPPKVKQTSPGPQVREGDRKVFDILGTINP